MLLGKCFEGRGMRMKLRWLYEQLTSARGFNDGRDVPIGMGEVRDALAAYINKCLPEDSKAEPLLIDDSSELSMNPFQIFWGGKEPEEVWDILSHAEETGEFRVWLKVEWSCKVTIKKGALNTLSVD
jgi:hypothetical protein